jgi:hypothetical protein
MTIDNKYEQYSGRKSAKNVVFPKILYTNISRNWKRRNYLKILKDCKSLVAFYPKGYSDYNRLLVTFKTEYETGLRESLGKLDRSSYLWKSDDTIF